MWLLLLLLVCILGAVVLGLLAWGLWKRVRDLARDLGTAAERFSAVTDELQRLQDKAPDAPEAAAVFDSPTRLRGQRATSKGKAKRKPRDRPRRNAP